MSRVLATTLAADAALVLALGITLLADAGAGRPAAYLTSETDRVDCA